MLLNGEKGSLHLSLPILNQSTPKAEILYAGAKHILLKVKHTKFDIFEILQNFVQSIREATNWV